jgi:uncharacterized protein (TIGR02246 family)
MTDDVRKAIEKVNLLETEGFRRGDAAAVAALYAEDAVLLPPNSEMIRGRQKIEEYWNTEIQMGVKDVVLTTVELSKVYDDTVHEMGDYTIIIHQNGKKPIEDIGKYIVIWKHTADGWKLYRDIWNSNLPPPQ